jgi:hypothetical protein
LALLSEFLHIQCLLTLSKYSCIVIGTTSEHIVYVGDAVRIELTRCKCPVCIRKEDIEVSCLSILFKIGL